VRAYEIPTSVIQRGFILENNIRKESCKKAWQIYKLIYRRFTSFEINNILTDERISSNRFLVKEEARENMTYAYVWNMYRSANGRVSTKIY